MLKEKIHERVKCCEPCQMCKNMRSEHGELPEREVHLVPRSDIAVDPMGPWKTKDEHRFDHELRALTVTDTVANYVKIMRLEIKTVSHVTRQFKNNWTTRYPEPNSVTFNAGAESKGEFREASMRLGIAPHPTTVKNPQANSICEQLHQSIAEAMRAVTHEESPEHRGRTSQTVDDALATAVCAAQTALHSTLGLSPGALAFNRDMLWTSRSLPTGVSGPVVRHADETHARCITNGYLQMKHDHGQCNSIGMISSGSLNKSSLF